MANDPHDPTSSSTTTSSAPHGSDSKSANIWLALLAGLAVGFAVGREMGARSAAGGAASGGGEGKPAVVAAAGGGAQYKSESEFPANWQKSSDLVGHVAGLSFDGLTDAHKVLVMTALNERKCTCGCGMESLAYCAKNDKACPVSPKLAKDLVERAKEGKSLGEMRTFLDGQGKPSPSPQAQAPSGPRRIDVPAYSPRKGPKNAKVTIVEFSDFQCPFCTRVVPTLKDIEKKYPKEVAIIFRHQPLSFHDRAMPAAQALMAAHRQGKAWEMHDKLFENQQALDDASLEKYAKDLGLNVAKYKKDFADPKVQQDIKADSAYGMTVGASGTPTFFINGRELSGAQPLGSFTAIIDEEIKKADALLQKGVKAENLYEELMKLAAAAPPPAPAAAAAPPAPAEKVDISPGDAPSKGPKNAPVTIIAFSDFQCPFCSRVVPTFKQIEDTYKDKVRVAFKHLPLAFHNNAQIAAEASMAAHEQGKFWAMHDKLFENQQALDRPNLDKYAADLGLDVGKFKAALDSSKYRDYVQKDAAQAGTVGATGTPSFFVNGRSLVGARPFDDFKKLIDEELAKAKK